MRRRDFVTVAAATSAVAGVPARAAAGSIGFALGSGALHGWAHIGIVRGVRRRHIADLPVRFATVASDARSGESVILNAGPVGLAVEASCAAPVWNEPVRVGSHELLDGSLTAPVPVAAVRGLGAQRIVAVDVAYRPHEEAPSSSSDYAFQAVHILTNALARA